MNKVFGDTNPEIYEYGPGIIRPDQASLNEKPTRESESLNFVKKHRKNFAMSYVQGFLL